MYGGGEERGDSRERVELIEESTRHLTPSPATSFIFILYICPLQSSLKDSILYIFFLSNNVL
jgi:hypothetical protein